MMIVKRLLFSHRVLWFFERANFIQNPIYSVRMLTSNPKVKFDDKVEDSEGKCIKDDVCSSSAVSTRFILEPTIGYLIWLFVGFNYVAWPLYIAAISNMHEELRFELFGRVMFGHEILGGGLAFIPLLITVALLFYYIIEWKKKPIMRNSRPWHRNSPLVRLSRLIGIFIVPLGVMFLSAWYAYLGRDWVFDPFKVISPNINNFLLFCAVISFGVPFLFYAGWLMLGRLISAWPFRLTLLDTAWKDSSLLEVSRRLLKAGCQEKKIHSKRWRTRDDISQQVLRSAVYKTFLFTEDDGSISFRWGRFIVMMMGPGVLPLIPLLFAPDIIEFFGQALFEDGTQERVLPLMGACISSWAVWFISFYLYLGNTHLEDFYFKEAQDTLARLPGVKLEQVGFAASLLRMFRGTQLSLTTLLAFGVVPAYLTWLGVLLKK
ncbi:MAG: hypothetical protein HQL52_15185 [Magnetococcales bacterium]|nr:hypothetical protein [Magnetococcales bacterium]